MSRSVSVSILASGLLLLALGCATRSGIHYLQEARELKGLSMVNVEAQLGTPADRQGTRLFYFLTEDSMHHPSPTSQLYEFYFENDRLEKIVPLKKGAP